MGPAMSPCDLAIICLPGSLYDFVPWTNRQHIMTRLARTCPVLYVEPPRYPWKQLAKAMLGLRREQQARRWFRRILSPEHRENHLYILALLQYLPTYRRAWRQFNYRLNLPRLRRIVAGWGFQGAVLWIYTPDAVALAGRLGERLLCYDCVDEYAEQPYYQDNFAEIRQDEAELLAKADVVFTTARNLYQRKRQANPNTYLTPNVGDYDHFVRAMAQETPIPLDIASLPQPVIGFVGAVDGYKVDLDLLERLAAWHAEWSIVLIGPSSLAERETDLTRLTRKGNIHLLGPRPYQSLPGYIKAFAACIIPYRINAYTQNCFPIKFFEFLASGKPVVVSNLPELEPYRHLVRMADSPETFGRALEEVLVGDTEEARQARLAEARRNTWEAKVARQLEIVAAALANRLYINRPPA